MNEGVTVRRVLRKATGETTRSINTSPEQRACLAKIEECSQELSLSKKQIADLGGYSHSISLRNPPGVVSQERVNFAVGKLWEAYRSDHKPLVLDVASAEAKAVSLITAGSEQTKLVSQILAKIQTNNWWWTKIPANKGSFGKTLRALAACDALQTYGQNSGRLYRIGSALADNPEVCSDLLIAPPTEEETVDQIENLVGLIEPSSEHAVISKRLERSPEPLSSTEERIDLHLNQVSDLLRSSDLTAEVRSELRNLKRSLLETQLQVFKP